MYFGFLVLAAQAGLVGFWIYDLRFTKSQITTHHAPRTTHYAILSGFGLATLLACLLYLPWWPVLLNLLRRRAAVGAIEGGVGDPVTFVTGVVDALGPQPTPVAWLFLALFGLGLIFLARSARPLAVFGLLWLALPVALPIFLGDPRALQFRYAFILPIYLTIIATAIGGLSHQIEQLISKSSITNPQGKRYQLPITNYLLWILATLSFIATLGIYAQTKPNWRAAAAYLTERTKAADLIVVAPLWDEGRFLEYYYRGAAPLLTPAALVTNIQGRAEGLRLGGGQIWGVSRFAPAESPATKNIDFTGVVIAEPQMPVYEPQLLAGAALDLAAQAVEAAYPWAVEAEAQGVLTPDPRTAQAVALRAWADALVAAGKPEEAVAAYQRAVDIFPGWVNGYLALAEAQEGLGNLPAAAKAYQQAVTFNLDWHGPPADEASRLVKAQAWADAIEQYHQITEN
jgi:tetratricopeptide (TPR) repeat protein